MNTIDLLRLIQNRLAAAAAMTAAYENWSDEFSRTEVKDEWLDRPAPLRKAIAQRITVSDLHQCDKDELFKMGFANWDGKLFLLPLWVWNYIADGECLTAIDGSTKIKGTDNIDLDVRMGAIAWGFSKE